MSVGAVAERYAQAVFELTLASGSALGSGSSRALADSLSTFAAAYSSDPHLKNVLEDPTVPKEQQKELLVALAQRCGVPELGLRTLLLMASRRRLAAVPAMADKVVLLVDEEEKVMRAEVTTAQKLPESFYAQLTEQLSKATGRRILLDRREDPEIIGGAIARVGDAFIDGSVRGRLQTLERQLTAALSAQS